MTLSQQSDPPADVRIACPVGKLPFLFIYSFHSSLNLSPDLSLIALAHPPSCINCSFAGLTIASVISSVKSFFLMIIVAPL